ncbi:MAG: HTTM domain-containing protein [Bacteroidota bacterium]
MSIRTVTSDLKAYFNREIDFSSLVFFRIAFGILMITGQIRFLANDWVYELYVQPKYFLKYYGFEWISVPDETGLYILYALSIVSALFISLGLFYRFSSIIFFAVFTYLELMDVSNYLNHYYFITVISFLMIFLPLNKAFSLDIKFGLVKEKGLIQRKYFMLLLICITGLYFMAGLSKLNWEWLFEANPMKIWLPQKVDTPLIGPLLDEPWMAYLLSWLGAAYDLSVPFLLFFRRTRKLALFSVFMFHFLTAVFFPIGMFPYIMMTFSLLFLENDTHKRLLGFIGYKSNGQKFVTQGFIKHVYKPLMGFVLFIFFVFPLRSHTYPGDLFWTEQGYRFSWRVMLMEKMGHCYFYVKDPNQPGQKEVLPSCYLTNNQERHMSRQPDLILQMANIIEEDYKNQGIQDPEVRVVSWVNLNGKGSQLFIDPSIDLTKIEDSWAHKDWIIPLDSVISPVDFKHPFLSRTD